MAQNDHVVAKVERHGQDQLKDLRCRAENQIEEILMRHVQWDIVQMDVVKTLPQNVCSSVFVARLSVCQFFRQWRLNSWRCRDEQLDRRVQEKSADVPVLHRTSENAIGQGAEVTVLQMLEEIVDVAYSVFEERIRRRIVEQISIVTSQQTTEVVTKRVCNSKSVSLLSTREFFIGARQRPLCLSPLHSDNKMLKKSLTSQ